MAAGKYEEKPQQLIQLHGNSMVGEEVRVTCCCGGNGALLPPLLVTQVDDKDEERDEDEVGDGHSRKDKDAYLGSETCACEQIEGRVGGRGLV